ncbi:MULTISPECIES: glycosyltransferase family 9 protein [unclassified Agarivorans]|uniref:glycosyltransferase family 9 protein n=1 Tax=unclassified Agarivorans TaxID=2636026 RepID=UPI003D7D59D7
MLRILIIRSGALGDTIFASAVMEVLHQAYPQASFDWIVSSKSIGLFEHDPRVTQCFSLKHRKLPIFISLEKQAIIRHSKQQPYDLVVNLEHHPTFCALAKAIQTRARLEINDHPITSNKVPHAVETMKQPLYALLRNESLASSLNQLNIADIGPRIMGEPLAKIEAKFKLPKHYIVLCPGNSHSKKSKINHRAWPEAHWIQLIKEFANSQTIVLLGSQADRQQIELWDLPKSSSILNLAGKTNLSELVALIEHAVVAVTTDSGPTHIASAVQTPNIALIGPTDPDSTGPYQTQDNHSQILLSNLDCQPCYGTDIQRQCTNNECMNQLTPELVKHTINKYLHASMSEQ